MFLDSLAQTFKLFSFMHIIPVTIILSIVYLIIKNKTLLQTPSYKRWIRFSFAGLIIVQELLLQTYRVVTNTWHPATSFPLQLCSIGVILTAIILMTESKKLFLATNFILLIGASLALLTPGIENGYGFPHFRYLIFFLSHGLIIINMSVILFVFDFQKDIQYRHLLYNFVTLIAIAIFLYTVNLMTGGNYMYLMEKPAPGTLFDAFGQYPIYLIQILLFGIPFFFHLFYIPYFIRDFHLKKHEQEA